MGVTYKLLPQIKAFIIEQKKRDPRLSCRKLSSLISKKFLINLSKSSINSMIKQAGLSSPIGRRRKVRRGLAEAKGLGCFLLKAVDMYLGGSFYLNEIIKNKLSNRQDPYLLETLLYLPLFKIGLDDQNIPLNSGLWSLVGRSYTSQFILSYLDELQAVKTLPLDILKAISDIFKEVWFIKITLSDNSLLYLDGELRTVWSTPNIPYDFSSTIYKSKGYINNYLNEDLPLIFFTAPGYDIPTKEFFDFLMVQDGLQRKMVKITLYGNKMEELETIRFSDSNKRYYIFGLWPWQFERYRKIKINDEFKAIYLEPLQEDFYIAEAEIALTQPKINQRVTLRGCVLKKSRVGKVNLIIATNKPPDKASLEDIVYSYLNQWPEPEKIFSDFSHKIELFTYTASSRKVFSIESLTLKPSDLLDVKEVLDCYLRCLDLFLRWRILPYEYEELDFSTTKQRFYDLKARIRVKKYYQLVSFILPQDYPFQKDLGLACSRLNEKEITLSDNKARLWFRIC